MLLPCLPLSEVRKRTCIETSLPQPAYKNNGERVQRRGRNCFLIKPEKFNYEASKTTPIKQKFFDEYVVSEKRKCTYLQLRVFIYVANTTKWSTLYVIVDEHGDPVLDENGQGRAAIETYGNRTATHSIQQIADALGADYGSVQKALRFWEKEGLFTEIKEKKNSAEVERLRSSGRPVSFKRYEIDPDYVWNGPLWVGVAYSLRRESVLHDITSDGE